MADADLCNIQRRRILDVAKGLATDGAHYLWGAEGQKPTTGGPLLYAPVTLGRDKADQSCFCAAVLNGCVCAGRCGRFTPRSKIADPPGTDADLLRFIDKYQSKSAAQFGWGDELTPRVIKGHGVKDYTLGRELSGKVVWGEGCDDTLHFDCGGFVRWVVQTALHLSISGISANPEQLNHFGKPMGALVAVGQTVLPADILVYEGHIAFATGDPPVPYSAVGHYNVAQAESGTEGVNYGKSRGGTNLKCIRLSDSTLLGRSQ